MNNKLLIVGLLGILLVGCVIICDNIIEEKITYEKIDTGLTPEQTWDIINGVDVGIVIKNGVNNNG